MAVVPSESPLASFLEPGPQDKATKFVEPHLSDVELRTALADEVSVGVLAFNDAAKTFRGFQDASLAVAVAKRLARLSNMWCCGSGSLRLLPYGLDASPKTLMAT